MSNPADPKPYDAARFPEHGAHARYVAHKAKVPSGTTPARRAAALAMAGDYPAALHALYDGRRGPRKRGHVVGHSVRACGIMMDEGCADAAASFATYACKLTVSL